MKHTGRYLVVLSAILIIGFLMRSYHLDFPSIGYHNMKENEVLSIAHEMDRTQDFRVTRVYFFNAFDRNPGVISYEKVPLVPYQILLAWNLFGENLWAPRLINIIFGVASIALMYFLSCILFGEPVIALWAALLLAIMPLGVFFSRNLQPESPAFFFMLLGNLLYVWFIRSRVPDAQPHSPVHHGGVPELLLGGLSFVTAWFYQGNFLIGIVPCLICMPYTALWRERSKFPGFLAALLFPWALMLICAGFFRDKVAASLKEASLFLDVFSPAYWHQYGRVFSWYIAGENFTWFYALLAVCGMVLALFKGKGMLNRYITGWIAAIAVYLLLYSSSLTQNSFMQMPFLALICVAPAYTVLFVRDEARRLAKRDFIIPLVILATGISAMPVYGSLTRMFGTVYLGADTAGESLREFTKPEERIFLLTYPQGNAVARYAQRYAGWPADIDDFKKKEQEFGVRFVCIFPGEFMEGLRKDNAAVFDYLQNNYHVKEIGLAENLQKMGYLILEKGKRPDNKTVTQTLQETVQGALHPRAIYKMFGRYVFFYAMRPEAK